LLIGIDAGIREKNMPAMDPRTLMVVIGGMGTIAQGFAAWWWFQASCHEVSDDADRLPRELREMWRLNARAAVAQSIAATCAVVLWLTGAYMFQG
jgi:hypothetical protein